MLFPLKKICKSFCRRVGYRVQYIPPVLRNRLDDEISLQLEHLVALQFCRNRDFYFIQVGAFDGSCVDPIHKMVSRYQWRGVLIEPEPRAFASLKETYAQNSRLTLLQAAISDKDGVATFYRMQKNVPGLPSKSALCSSLDKEMLLLNVGAQFAPYVETLEVPCYTLSSLFFKRDIKSVDLLQIDAEGFDLKVLRSLDFKAVRPAIINFEHTLLSSVEQNEAWNLLLGNGYKLHIRPPDTMACCSSLID